MKKYLLLILFHTVYFGLVNAQGPTLAPGIGLFSQPLASDSVCPIQTYIDPNGTYLIPGLANGQLIPDFTLYDRTGNAMNMQSKLAAGKPVLIVSGSYTCPVFRNKINLINNLKNTYANSLDIFIIYTVEAHPTDTSPYFGSINVGSANTSQGILFAQPKTYGQRVAMVDTLLAKMNVTVPVYIDGPCNNWWNTYGPAPNNAYLITTQGNVFVKHGWFNKGPLHNIQYDIDSLLNIGGGTGNPNAGTFSFQMLGDSIVTGTVGTTIFAYSKVYNNSTNPVTLDVIRLENNMPAGWATSMCTDVCLPPHIDATQLYLAPGDTQSFTMYFYTDFSPNTGNTRILFKNIDNASNTFEQRYFAESILNSSITETKNSHIKLFPNPASGEITIQLSKQYSEREYTLEVFSSTGKKISSYEVSSPDNVIPIESKGFLLYRILYKERIVKSGHLINY